ASPDISSVRVAQARKRGSTCLPAGRWSRIASGSAWSRFSASFSRCWRLFFCEHLAWCHRPSHSPLLSGPADCWLRLKARGRLGWARTSRAIRSASRVSRLALAAVAGALRGPIGAYIAHVLVTGKQVEGGMTTQATGPLDAPAQHGA